MKDNLLSLASLTFALWILLGPGWVVVSAMVERVP